MSVTFPRGNSAYIDYSTVSAIQGLTTMSFMYWLNLTSDVSSDAPDVYQFELLNGTGTNEGHQFMFNPNVSGNLQLSFYWSTTNGIWRAAKPTSGSDFLLTITYDRSATSNNPSVYYNTTSKSVTRSTAPSGTYLTGTTNTLRLGGDLGGTIKGYAVYNTIVSAAYIAAAVAAGSTGWYSFIQQYSTGLVMAPQLGMADGLTFSTFAGATLSGSNYMRSATPCCTGTPTGSPIGA